MAGKAKYTEAEIKQHIKEFVIKQKRDRRIPARSQLAKKMGITTRTLWTYRQKYPEIFHDMDIDAIKQYVGKAVNYTGGGWKVENTLRTLLQTYKPYFAPGVVIEPISEELAAVVSNPLKRALLRLGMEVGMEFKIR